MFKYSYLKTRYRSAGVRQTTLTHNFWEKCKIDKLFVEDMINNFLSGSVLFRPHYMRLVLCNTWFLNVPQFYFSHTTCPKKKDEYGNSKSNGRLLLTKMYIISEFICWYSIMMIFFNFIKRNCESTRRTSGPLAALRPTKLFISCNHQKYPLTVPF